MGKYIILSEKSWHKETYVSLKARFTEHEWILINKKDEFSIAKVEEIKPDKIFIPHWSYIISSDIFSNFECIVFHMTDLPFGRGGSPLQNLIVRGFKETKISALKVEEGLDTGPIYLKKQIDLFGTAKEIFLRSTSVIEEMVSEIIAKDLKPVEQEGEVVNFKRRKPAQGNIAELDSLGLIYDYIRMLDCEGYPKAFIENENFRLEFSRASFKSNDEILAEVRIKKKN